MSLPFDPSILDQEDIGEQVAALEMDHDEAVEYVREVCLEEGFGIPVEFSPSDLLNEKVDADRDPLYVLGACNPEMADRALEETLDIAALFPCNMIVRQVEPGIQEVHHVSIMKIARLTGMAPDNDAWDGVVADTGALVDATFQRLRTGSEAP